VYRRDYIQKQLEEFGKFLAKLADHKASQRYQDFEAEIESAAKTFIGKALQEVEILDEKLLEAYSSGLESSQKKILARLFFERMQLCDELGQEAAATVFANKSRLVYQLLYKDQTATEFDLDVHYKLELLNARSSSK
jgi:hypothetical protein